MKTIKEEGYKYYKRLGIKLVVFEEISTGKKEVFVANKNHANWGFSWHGTDWEFSFDYDKLG